MWRIRGGADAGQRGVTPPPVPPDRARDSPSPHAFARSRTAIEEDLRALQTLRAGLRRGDIGADRAFEQIIGHRTDRLLDELLRADAGPQATR